MAHYSVLPNVCNIQLTGLRKTAAQLIPGSLGWCKGDSQMENALTPRPPMVITQ